MVKRVNSKSDYHVKKNIANIGGTTKMPPKTDRPKPTGKAPTSSIKPPHTTNQLSAKNIPPMGKASESIKKVLDKAKAVGKKVHGAAKSHLKDLIKKHGSEAIDKVGDTVSSLVKDKAPTVTHGLIDKGTKYIKDKLKSKI